MMTQRAEAEVQRGGARKGDGRAAAAAAPARPGGEDGVWPGQDAGVSQERRAAGASGAGPPAPGDADGPAPGDAVALPGDRFDVSGAGGGHRGGGPGRCTNGPLPPVPALVALQATVSAASLVVEIVAGRVLAPYVGMSLYTWTAVIAVVLAGFSAGHWLGGRIAEGPAARALARTGWCLAAAAATTGAALVVLRSSAEAVLGATGSPVLAITALTALAFFLPSFFAGVPAPVLARVAILADPPRAGRALGAMFAAGALGAIAGTLLAGFLFVSWIGSAGTLAAMVALYAVLAALTLAAAARARGGRGRGTAALAGVAALLPAAALLAGPDPCTRESDHFCIRVVDLADGPEGPVRLMVLDHLAHGVSARDAPEVMFTQHTAMLDRLARARTGAGQFRAFFIGGGSYSIPRAWAARAPVPEMTVAEIDPAVTEIAAERFWFDPASARILHADARRALASEPEGAYDVVIGDAFTDIAVPQHLVTREFFALVRSRLAPDGSYLMNVIDHTDRLDALASILRTLDAVFPVVEVWAERRGRAPGERIVVVVVAGERPTPRAQYVTRAPGPLDFGRLSRDWIAERMAQPGAVLMTDDYAPIDRLMVWRD